MKTTQLGMVCPKLAKWLVLSSTFMATSIAVAQEVIPDFYRDPGLNPNRSYVNQSFNEHIDPFTGSLQQHYVDLHIPGNGGFDLSVVRSYNSVIVEPLNPNIYNSLLALGWTLHFGRVLKGGNDTQICINKAGANMLDNPVLEMPDGSRQILSFTSSGTPLMLTTQRWRAECINSGGGLAVYSPDGTRYDMTQMVNLGQGSYAWHTTKITDKNGNYANVSYLGQFMQEIASISTNDGRSINFTYHPVDSGQLTRRIYQISSGQQVYTYDYVKIPNTTSAYLLTSVTRPDTTKWLYSYNGDKQSLPGSYVMNKTTHPQGGFVDYEYGYVLFDPRQNPYSKSTVITKKNSSSGGVWQFNYLPGSSQGDFDTTTITTPAGTEVYKHCGPNCASNGTVWTVGLLMHKSIGSKQTEAYTWDKQKISNETYSRSGFHSQKIDLSETNAPIMTQRTITRDGASYTTSYSNFDAYGNPGTITETGTSGGTRTTNLTYYINTTAWIVKQVQNESFSGGSVTRSFNANGNLQSMVRDGVTTSYTYDSQGNIASTTFPRSLTHTYSNYKRGIPQSEGHPESVSISRIVSDAGNVTQETNGDGYTTTYGYDGLNRVTSIGYPIGNSVSISYGTASKTATRGSLVENVLYNGFGQPTSITIGGITRTMTVDALGRTTFQSNPGSSSGTGYTYDELNRVTRVSKADGSSQTITYGAGTKTNVDERGKSTTATYRAYGNPDQQFLMSIAAADSSANVTIARNTRDLMTSVTQGGFTRNYGYDNNYYLTSVTNPETGTTTYGRDAAGNMTSRSVGSSGTSTYTYDSLNRLTAVTYPGSTPSVSNTYNKTNKLLTATSSTGNRTFSYDQNGNLTSESLAIDGYTFASTYTYNNLDQLSTITYPRSGAVVSYSPDVLGRPTQVSGYVTGVTYWPSGQVKQINYANGTVSSYDQNSRLWPSTFSTSKSGTTYIDNRYNYDGAGNLTKVSDAVDSSYERTLSYDNINRVTSISGPWGSGSIAYNGVGNITSQIFGSSNLSYSYDGNNRLSSVSGAKAATYTYDAYGDVTSAAGNTYTYDGVPNLRCVNCSNAASKIEYSYDAANHRSVVSKAGVKTYEMYGANGNQLIEYTPSDSNKLVQYIYLGGKRIAQRVSY